PDSIGSGDDSSNLDPTRLEIDHEQHEVPHETLPRDPFDREEVGRGDRSPVRLQEGLPAHGPPARGIDSVLRKDSLDGVSPDEESEIRKRAPDSRIAPARVVARHLEDPSLDLAIDPWATRTALRAPVVLLGHELPVPAQQRVRGDDRGEFAEPGSSEWLGLSR